MDVVLALVASAVIVAIVIFYGK